MKRSGSSLRAGHRLAVRDDVDVAPTAFAPNQASNRSTRHMSKLHVITP